MTISSDAEGAKVTLAALQEVRQRFGVRTVLGVSNISFGLPNRAIINSNFYTMAMHAGLTAGIINPSSEDMMRAYASYCALMNYDKNFNNYIARYGQQETSTLPTKETEKKDLSQSIQKGWKEEAIEATKDLVCAHSPLEIIDNYLIPALDAVGQGFENGSVFLPQLLMSAEAAKSAFDILKEQMQDDGGKTQKNKVLIATVKGDIHDIGKNIVKVLLENYSYDVVDLGKDVAPEEIVKVAKEQNISVVGLSALMTTTVISMEETIRQIRNELPNCKVMVGGAVLNQEYADMIGADYYAKDAMQAVTYVQNIFRK